MEAGDGPTDVVHPEVRAHINSLVSALGGYSAEDDGRYVLGDSALEVLRDIKKWIRFYDEKTNRMDVARCLADANLVGGDLLAILALWPENDTDNKFKARCALACFEIIVPLTWPLVWDTEKMTVNHYRHLPALQLSQVGYMRKIINFDSAQILHTAVRVALSSMAIPIGDRAARDQGIIKLVLFFLRNMAMITPPPGAKYDGDESQISRSALIDAFSYQDIFLTLLTIASNIGEDFNQEDVIIMETIFHLVKRVNPGKLFMNEKELSKAKSDELASLMSKEAAMHRSHNRTAPTRHNRWGTMIWVKRDDGKVSTISGQDALLNAATRQQKMDKTKTFKPPRRPRKDEMEPKDLGPSVTLNARANGQLRGFVEDFLDSGFNPLFQHVRKSLDNEKHWVFEYHRRQFFYLVSWFLEAERMRRKYKKSQPKSGTDPNEVSSFNLVAGVLNQEMFVLLNKSMQRSYDEKDWQELSAAMRCFSQILLTIQEMTESGNEEDEEIAENILNRIFYEEETHDRVANIARTYKDQGFEYLDACTELTHTYLRILEAYSKQNVDMQVRSRRRTRRKKKAAQVLNSNEDGVQDEGDDSADDEANAQQTSRERNFDFTRFANRFIPQGVVDTFVQFIKYYQDLNDSQLKRAHRYFYRVAFKQDMSVMLFRVDIMHLFHSMIKGPGPLDKNSSTFKEWEELVKQLIKKCTRKIEDRPALIIEMLFSKIQSTAYYLEYGHEKQTLSTTTPRPGAELEFRHIFEHDQQIAVAVGVLLDKNLGDHISWVKKQLASAAAEREAWEAADKAMASVESQNAPDGEVSTAESEKKEPPAISVRPDDVARRQAIFKSSHLRLLMRLVGFVRMTPSLEETLESTWIIPPELTADKLQESIDLIVKAEFNPPTFEDGQLAEHQLRRKAAPRKRAAYDDDGAGSEDDGEQLFAPGGPTARKVLDDFIDDGKLKKTRRSRRKVNASGDEEEDEGPTEEELAARRKARKDRERERNRKIKSELYVHASDDETDEERDREFFANEEKIRQRVKKTLLSVPTESTLLLGSGALERGVNAEAVVGTKKPTMILSDESDGDEDEDEDMPLTQGSSAKSAGGMNEEGEDDSDTDDTPRSPSPQSATSGKRKRASRDSNPVEPQVKDIADGDADENEDEDEPVAKRPARQRARVKAGFVLDSSDEE